MRRRYEHLLPALSRIHGIKPWEIDDLTPREFARYLADLPQSPGGA